MEENNKVIIFEKKEIVLVLIFVVVLIITSFTLGIRLGRKLAFTDSGLKVEDVKAVELKSAVEEDADATISQDAKLTDDEKLKKMMDESKSRLTNELEKFSVEEKPLAMSKAPTNNSVGPEPLNSGMTGKFTIQLGSYNTVDDAKQFAEGFSVRGYNPIINEVKIEDKGVWYRVSLGMFNTVDEAKIYIKEEQSLFSGQDHVITEIR